MFAALTLVLFAGVAQATTINDWTNGLGDTIYKETGLYKNPTDQLPYDETWEAGRMGVLSLVLKQGNLESLGIYELNGAGTLATKIPILISGQDRATFAFGWTDGKYDGRVYVNDVRVGNFNSIVGTTGQVQFGFYLQTAPGPVVFYSQSALNSDGADHMVTFGNLGINFRPDDLLIAWDTIYNAGGYNFDFNDVVFAVESTAPAAPVPEPSTLVLLGGGLLGLGVAGYRRMQKK